MVFRKILLLMVAMTCSTTACAGENIFAELEEIYLVVFAGTVRDHERADRVLSVAMAIEDDVKPISMPDRIWKRLKSILEARQVNVSRIVPADQVVWVKADSKFVDKVSGKDAWVYSIAGITWHGTDRLYVSEYVTHGNLAGGGSTLLLIKKNGKWEIVGKTEDWVSQMAAEGVSDKPSAPKRGGFCTISTATRACGPRRMPRRRSKLLPTT